MDTVFSSSNLGNSAWYPPQAGGGQNFGLSGPWGGTDAWIGGRLRGVFSRRNRLYPPRGCHVVMVSSLSSGVVSKDS